MMTNVHIKFKPCDLDKLRTQSNSQLYAILDACDEPLIPPKVLEWRDHTVSLYGGKLRIEYEAIAPYLVELNDAILDWIVAELGETPWGIFASSAEDLVTVRNHFRKFLKVKGPDGEELFFRFYDPRVLPTFLETCNREEVEQFFGPIDAFLTLSTEGDFVRITRR